MASSNDRKVAGQDGFFGGFGWEHPVLSLHVSFLANLVRSWGQEDLDLCEGMDNNSSIMAEDVLRCN